MAATTKVIRRVTIPTHTVTIGSGFKVYHLHTNDPATDGKWAVYDRTERLFPLYGTAREANAVRREFDDRRSCLIRDYFKPHPGNEIVLGSAQGGGR
jgi:hypothetical protein